MEALEAKFVTGRESDSESGRKMQGALADGEGEAEMEIEDRPSGVSGPLLSPRASVLVLSRRRAGRESDPWDILDGPLCAFGLDHCRAGRLRVTFKRHETHSESADEGGEPVHA